MKNKQLYLAISSIVIVLQSISLWHAGKSRLERVRGPIEKEISFEPRKATFEKRRTLEEGVASGERKKFDFRKATPESMPTLKKKSEKKSEKKMDARTGEAFKLPSHLYLIVSSKTWQESKNDRSFPAKEYVHFWKEEQLKEIGQEEDFDHVYVILKVATDKIEGKWVYKADKEGEEKFFFLYKGLIPMASIIESKTILKGF